MKTIEWWILLFVPARRAYRVIEVVAAPHSPAALLASKVRPKLPYVEQYRVIARPKNDATVPVIP